MLEVVRNNNFNMYPMLTNSAFLMGLNSLGKQSSFMPIQSHERPYSPNYYDNYGRNPAKRSKYDYNDSSYSKRSRPYESNNGYSINNSLDNHSLRIPTVKAATRLNSDSSTEIIDVSGLSKKVTSPLIQYVEIADADGALYCVDRRISAACWLKFVTIAKDCQSCNVLLMSTEKGVVLKTITNITAGEPLLMWFTEKILAMLKMAPLSPHLNLIIEENCYQCHVCKKYFQDPNPLKIHLALNCNRLDNHHLWSQLVQEFHGTSQVAANFFDKLPALNFDFVSHKTPKLTKSPLQLPTRTLPPSITRSTPVSFENKNKRKECDTDSVLDSRVNFTSPSPTSSIHTSPPSLATSPTSGYYSSSSSSISQISPVKRGLSQRHSAFKPYSITKPSVTPISVLPPLPRSPEALPLIPFNMQSSVIPNPLGNTSDPAETEAIASNLGKSMSGHQCIFCGKVYSRKYGLKIHIRIHTGYKPLNCKYCDKSFGDPSNLNKHVRLHAEGNTPYKCDLCGKVLVRRRDLERHMKSRHRDTTDLISDDTNSDSSDVDV